MTAFIYLVFAPLILSATALRFVIPTVTVTVSSTPTSACLPTGNVLSIVAASGSAAAPLITATDASLVSAVAEIQADMAVLSGAYNTIQNFMLLIETGLAKHYVPPTAINDCLFNTTKSAAAIDALTRVVAGGVSQASAASLAADISTIATIINNFSTQLQQLQTAGSAFTSQFAGSLTTFLTSLQALVAALGANYNVNAVAIAAETLNANILALSSS
ncbi:hypothetical protein C8F04DRAFT_679133 [Mycena alexandri]|uniref:Uncharacterized protein n=1 Tax=Mycena alexandri TaxID=1745969 RepID=A0AAD6TDT0_9AGAR|nr:hypothetical protein C8F04DRAFT_679133 [Mycena alexandri]